MTLVKTQFNPSGLKRSEPRRETTKQRNVRRKVNARIKKERACVAVLEATEAMKHEAHLKTGIMRDLEKMYGKRFTRAAGNTTYVLDELALFHTMR